MQPFEQLEIEFAEWLGLNPAGMVACASGTAALHLALEALQLPPGSEVVVPDLTMAAVPRAVKLAELEPVLVDCADDLLSDWKASIVAMGERVAAEVFVHTYGRQDRQVQVRAECNVAKKTQWQPIRYVEDLAEAHGIKPHDDTDAACWSFYKNKCVHGEEGGAVWFKDPVHAALARSLRTLGFTADHNFMHAPRGHNYRMSNVHAELVLRSLRLVAAGIGGLEARREVESWCDELCPAEWRMPPRASCWVYDMILPDGDAQDRAVAACRANGIEARHCFAPMHMQPEFAGCRRVGGENAERLAKRVMYLPVKPGLTHAWCRYSFEVVKEAVG